MKHEICRKLRELLTVPPRESSGYKSRLEQARLLEFLQENAGEEKVVVYADLYINIATDFFINSVWLPEADTDPSNIENLAGWNYLIRRTAWSVFHEEAKAWIEPSLGQQGNRGFERGESLVFNRELGGVQELAPYVEILQKFSHVCGIHYIPERKAWCRLGSFGDIEEVVQVVTVDTDDEDGFSGKIVLSGRDVLEKYAMLTKTVLVRMFDSTMHYVPEISAPRNQRIKSNGENIFYRYSALGENSSRAKGVQIIPIAVSEQEVAERIHGLFSVNNTQQEEFKVACDPENKKIVDAVYKVDMPVSIAFFRPEVLSKYKANPEKYCFGDNYLSCRYLWGLGFFDINEEGQVYTSLKHLSDLPNEEQRHWKQFNEKPKAMMADYAIRRLFHGEFRPCYSPLEDMKSKLVSLQCKWWKMPTPGLAMQVHYPVTESNKEWKDEILLLDQMLVEGFKEKWLRRKAGELGRSPKEQDRSLVLLEECLAGLGFEEGHARSIVSPLRELHNLRDKLGAHAPGKTAEKLKKEALSEHGSYRNHYKALVTECNETVRILIKAFEDPRMN